MKKESKTTNLTYRMSMNRQQFDRECAVRRMERYDDCIVLTTGWGQTKVPHGFFDKMRPMIVCKGDAP